MTAVAIDAAGTAAYAARVVGRRISAAHHSLGSGLTPAPNHEAESQQASGE